DRDVSVDEDGAANAEDVRRGVPVELPDDEAVRVLRLARVVRRRREVEGCREAGVARRVVVEGGGRESARGAWAQSADRGRLVVVVPVSARQRRRVDRVGLRRITARL